MKKRFYRILNNVMVGLAFIGSTILWTKEYYIWSFICFILSYGVLDLNKYFDIKYRLNG